MDSQGNIRKWNTEWVRVTIIISLISLPLPLSSSETEWDEGHRTQNEVKIWVKKGVTEDDFSKPGAGGN